MNINWKQQLKTNIMTTLQNFNQQVLLEAIAIALDYTRIEAKSCLMIKKDGHVLLVRNDRVAGKQHQGYTEFVSSAQLVSLFGVGYEVSETPENEAAQVLAWANSQN